jgi:hypothetical protein
MAIFELSPIPTHRDPQRNTDSNGQCETEQEFGAADIQVVAQTAGGCQFQQGVGYPRRRADEEGVDAAGASKPLPDNEKHDDAADTQDATEVRVVERCHPVGRRFVTLHIGGVFTEPL